tara:strand:+ start:244 stop:507 length:264 start_codon:yes stop_codon:yes gene_type:complete
MKFSVYMLISINKNRAHTYVGYSSNLKKRILLHNNSKGAKYTRGRIWKIIYKKNYKTKSLAMKNEFKLKKNYKKRNEIKIKYLQKFL